MKKCPFCAEDIQDEAVKCRYCGEMLEKKESGKWYFRISTLIIAFLCIGPLALPLVWLNPRFSRKTKIIITLITVIVTYFLVLQVVDSLKSIKQYYQMIFQSF